jgi:L-alanine-DL-glutamate epimerase-like enolase superfamily enzyme
LRPRIADADSRIAAERFRRESRSGPGLGVHDDQRKARRAWRALRGGWRTIDMAVWDAVAKIAQKPLFQLLAERYGNGKSNRQVFVYAAGGYYYPGKDHEALKREMKSYIDRGYTVVKMKIGGELLAEDVRRIEAVLGYSSGGRSAWPWMPTGNSI